MSKHLLRHVDLSHGKVRSIASYKMLRCRNVKSGLTIGVRKLTAWRLIRADLGLRTDRHRISIQKQPVPRVR